MTTPFESSRYARQIRLPEFGERGQALLKQSSAVIIGAGGLGSPAAMYLAAAGVGRIGLVDFDVVDPTNLHRQILYTEQDVGGLKAAAAAKRLHAMNGDIEVIAHAEQLSAANALAILERYDVVLDGTDNFATRYLVNDACAILGKPNVYGSVFRLEGQASVFNLPDGPCYRCLYPHPPAAGLLPNCEEAGVLGVLPGIIGTIQAAEALKLLAGLGRTLSGRLLLFDAADMTFREMMLRRNCDEHERITKLTDYGQICMPIDISPTELAERIGKADSSLALLDVREPHEWAVSHLPGALHIPLQQVPQRLDEIPRDRDVVVYCRSGSRSAYAQRFLEANGFERVRNLTGGLQGWRREVDPSLSVA